MLGKTASLTVGGQVLTPAAIVSLLQARIDASNAVQPAEASRIAALAAEKDERAKTTALVRSLRRLLVGMFEADPETLAKFGLKAPKAPKRSVANKAAAQAKSKATRAAHANTKTAEAAPPPKPVA